MVATNCFLVKDASITYKISTTALNIGGSFNFININRFKLSSQLDAETNMRTSFKNISSSTIEFPSNFTEQFTTLRLKFGFYFSYHLTKQFQIGIAPSYAY